LNGDREVPRGYGVAVAENWTGRVENLVVRDSADKWVAYGELTPPVRVVGRWEGPYVDPAKYYDPDRVPASPASAAQMAQFQNLKELDITAKPLATDVSAVPNLTGYTLNTDGRLMKN